MCSILFSYEVDFIVILMGAARPVTAAIKGSRNKNIAKKSMAKDSYTSFVSSFPSVAAKLASMSPNTRIEKQGPGYFNFTSYSIEE